jgi:hypothetical protein
MNERASDAETGQMPEGNALAVRAPAPFRVRYLIMFNNVRYTTLKRDIRFYASVCYHTM